MWGTRFMITYANWSVLTCILHTQIVSIRIKNVLIENKSHNLKQYYMKWQEIVWLLSQFLLMCHQIPGAFQPIEFFHFLRKENDGPLITFSTNNIRFIVHHGSWSLNITRIYRENCENLHQILTVWKPPLDFNQLLWSHW